MALYVNLLFMAHTNISYWVSCLFWKCDFAAQIKRCEGHRVFAMLGVQPEKIESRYCPSQRAL